VGDFAHGKIAVRKSKSGKARHVRLAEEGAEFFRQLCLGRDAAEPWGKSPPAPRMSLTLLCPRALARGPAVSL
jgi:hypothetical protein